MFDMVNCSGGANLRLRRQTPEVEVLQLQSLPGRFLIPVGYGATLQKAPWQPIRRAFVLHGEVPWMSRGELRSDCVKSELACVNGIMHKPTRCKRRCNIGCWWYTIAQKHDT